MNRHNSQFSVYEHVTVAIKLLQFVLKGILGSFSCKSFSKTITQKN